MTEGLDRDFASFVDTSTAPSTDVRRQTGDSLAQINSNPHSDPQTGSVVVCQAALGNLNAQHASGLHQHGARV